MKTNCLSPTFDGVDLTYLDTSEHSDPEDGSQERPQQSLGTEPPPSPWSSIADPGEMLSNCGEAFESSGLDGTCDDSREPSVSIGNNEYDEVESLISLAWKNDTDQIENWETSHAISELHHVCAETLLETKEFIESVDLIGIQSRQGSSTGFDIHTKQSGFQRPSIVISNDKRSPNNYELAMHERQPPSVPVGIDPRSKKSAADNLQAFCVDADLTEADTATAYPDPNLLHVKTRRTSGTLPKLQRLTKNVPSLPDSQSSACSPRDSSSFQNHLQSPAYPTPPPPFEYQSSDQHLVSADAEETTPFSQTTSSRNSPIEPPSPISLSPSSPSEAAVVITRCPICPNTIFTGTSANQRNSLQRHKRDHHVGMSKLKCPVEGCSVSFAPGRKDNQVKHVRATHPEFSLPTRPTKRKRKT